MVINSIVAVRNFFNVYIDTSNGGTKNVLQPTKITKII